MGFSTSSAITLVSGVPTDIGTVLFGVLPDILLAFGVLLGIGLGLFYLRKLVARRKA